MASEPSANPQPGAPPVPAPVPAPVPVAPAREPALCPVPPVRAASTRRRLLLALLAFILLLAASFPLWLPRLVAWRIVAALEDDGFAVAPGTDFDVDVLGGRAVANLSLSRERPWERLRIDVERAEVRFRLADLFGREPRVAEVRVLRPRIRAERLGRAPARLERTRSPVTIDRLVIEGGEIAFADRATAPSPIAAVVEALEVEGRDLKAHDLVATLFRGLSVRGRLRGGGRFEAAPLPGGGGRRAAAEDIPLAPFSPYAERELPLAIRGGRARAVAVVREVPDGPGGAPVFYAQVHVEIEGLAAEVREDASAGFTSRLSAKALASYLAGHTGFFAQDFEVRLPARDLTGLLEHDLEAVGKAGLSGLLDAVLADRVDPRNPPLRDLHPEVRDLASLPQRYPGPRLAEVFAGCLNRRAVPELGVLVAAVEANGGLFARDEAVLHGLAGTLRVEVRGPKTAIGAPAPRSEVVLRDLAIEKLRPGNGNGRPPTLVLRLVR